MINKLLVFFHLLWEFFLAAVRSPNGNILPAFSAGSMTPEAVKSMEQDHSTTYFVKEFIIVGKGCTYVWWTAKGVMNYKLHKIVYHTGEAVYFHGDNKVLWVIDANGKRWT